MELMRFAYFERPVTYVGTNCPRELWGMSAPKTAQRKGQHSENVSAIFSNGKDGGVVLFHFTLYTLLLNSVFNLQEDQNGSGSKVTDKKVETSTITEQERILRIGGLSIRSKMRTRSQVGKLFQSRIFAAGISRASRRRSLLMFVTG